MMKIHAQFLSGPYKGLLTTVYLPRGRAVEDHTVRVAQAGQELDDEEDVVVAEYRVTDLNGLEKHGRLWGAFGAYEFVALRTSARSLVDLWVPKGSW